MFYWTKYFSVCAGVALENKVVFALGYADNLIVFVKSNEQQQRMMMNISIAGEGMDLFMSVNKSKIMVFKRYESLSKCWRVGNWERFLGCVYSNNGRIYIEIERGEYLLAIWFYEQRLNLCSVQIVAAKLAVYQEVYFSSYMWLFSKW